MAFGAGLLGSVPGLAAVAASAEANAPEVDSSLSNSVALEDSAILDGPLVAHIKDVNSGEIALYYGRNEVVLRDRQLAARLFQTAR